VAPAYCSSKSALMMLTTQYAKALPTLRINVVDPGYTATDLNGNSGTQTVTEGTDAIVAMAQGSGGTDRPARSPTAAAASPGSCSCRTMSSPAALTGQERRPRDGHVAGLPRPGDAGAVPALFGSHRLPRESRGYRCRPSRSVLPSRPAASSCLRQERSGRLVGWPPTSRRPRHRRGGPEPDVRARTGVRTHPPHAP